MQIIIDKVDCSPEEVSYDPSRIETLASLFENLIADSTLLGASYCLSRNDKIFANNAQGYFTYKKDSMLQTNTIHRIASITKLFTAVSIMKLIEDGLIRTDNPVCDILPQFKTPPFNKINVGHLLTHTSGIAPDPGVIENKYQKTCGDRIRTAYDLAENKEEVDWISAGISAGKFYEPGKQWMYSSFGFVLLGAIIEKVTGIFANDYIIQNICKPLKMDDTFFKIPKEKINRVIVKDSWAEESLHRILNDENTSHAFYDQMPSTGGGLYSTLSDLNRFGNMLLQKGTYEGVRILGRKTVEKMTELAIFNVPDHTWGGNEPNRKYALGPDRRNTSAFLYSEETFFHEGAGACALMMDPKENLCATWFVPFGKDGWFAKPLHSAANVIWSGLE